MKRASFCIAGDDKPTRGSALGDLNHSSQARSHGVIIDAEAVIDASPCRGLSPFSGDFSRSVTVRPSLVSRRCALSRTPGTPCYRRIWVCSTLPFDMRQSWCSMLPHPALLPACRCWYFADHLRCQYFVTAIGVTESSRRYIPRVRWFQVHAIHQRIDMQGHRSFGDFRNKSRQRWNACQFTARLNTHLRKVPTMCVILCTFGSDRRKIGFFDNAGAGSRECARASS